MPFEKSETVPAGLRRMSKLEVADALAQLRRISLERQEPVHEIRKHFKRMRALVKLVRDPLGERLYRRENQFLRDAGHLLGPARDSLVLVRALDDLEASLPDDSRRRARTALSAWRTRLQARHRRAIRQLLADPSLAALRDLLRSERSHILGWKIPDRGFDSLADGLSRAYRSGRSCSAKVRDERTDEVFHEWRRRAKDLRYQVASLATVRPKRMTRLEKRLHRLTDLLGDDHDYAVLRTTLGKGRARSAALRPVLAWIDERRSKLQRRAMVLGKELYADRPRDFIDRVRSDWADWRARGEHAT